MARRAVRIATAAGFVALLIGAIDPLEGSVVILLGGMLVVAGTYFDESEARWRVHRLWSCALLAFGIAALWGSSYFGGIGGADALPAAAGILLLPYPIGWLLAISDPGAKPWVHALGIIVGVFYLSLAMLTLTRSPAGNFTIAFVLSSTGVLAIAGCAYRLLTATQPAQPE